MKGNYVMKMQKAQFEKLKADFWAIAKARPHVARTLTMRDVWEVFHQVCEDRSYDDTHPFFTKGMRVRVLPYEGHGSLNMFYNAGLNDAHIETALRRIISE